MFALGESYAGHFVCKWGGCAPSNKQESSSPPSMLAPKNKHQVVAVWIIHVCTGGKLRGSFCLRMCAPPQPPRFLKAMDACKKTKQGSGRRQHRCLQKTSIRSSLCGSFMLCTWGKLRGSFCLGLRPPQPPRF